MKLIASLVSVLVLAACDPVTTKGDSDGGNNNIDGGGGGTPDAMVSADAAPGIATVRVFDNELAPRIGVKVLFSNRDGSQISVKTTNSNGETTETVPAGAIVTVAVAEQDAGATNVRYWLYQIHDVQPGDQVEVGPRGIAADWSSLGSTRVGLQGSFAGTDHYEIGTDCSGYWLDGATTPLELDYNFQNDDCHGTAARRDLLVYAWGDSAEDNLLAWTTIDDVQLGSGTTATSGAWSTAFDDVSLTASNFPFTGNAGVSMHQYRANVDYTLDSSGDGGAVTAGQSLVVNKKLPRGFADGVQLRVQGFGMNGTDTVISFIIRNVSRSASSHTVDFDTIAYPSFTSVQVDMSMPNRPRMTWTETGDVPSSAEARIGFVRWETPSNDEWEWQILRPVSAASPLVSPVLPPNFLVHPTSGSSAWPPPSDATPQTIASGMIEFGDLDGWDEVRQGRGLSVFGEDDDFLPPNAPVGSTTILWAGGVIQFN